MTRIAQYVGKVDAARRPGIRVPIGTGVAHQDHRSPLMPNHHPTTKARQAALERALMEDYLDWCGHTRQSVRALPEAEAAALTTAASEYASLRLAEIDFRAHWFDEIHRSS